MPDREGSIALLSPNGWVSDGFRYHESWHHPLLIDKNGVSLERISVDHPTSDPNNWASGAEAQGYATPGKANSQKLQVTAGSEILVDPKVFSPLSPGQPQYTQILFSFPSTPNALEITVYDSSGSLVRKLRSNSISGASGVITWDGTDEQFRRVPMGYYIIVITNLNPTGQIHKWLETVVVGPQIF